MTPWREAPPQPAEFCFLKSKHGFLFDDSCGGIVLGLVFVHVSPCYIYYLEKNTLSTNEDFVPEAPVIGLKDNSRGGTRWD